MYWSVIESERLLAGIAFDQDALHSRGIIKRPNRPQTGGSSVDAVQAIAIRLIRGWIWIPIGCLNSHPLRTIPSLCKNKLAGKTNSPDVRWREDFDRIEASIDGGIKTGAVVCQVVPFKNCAFGEAGI